MSEPLTVEESFWVRWSRRAVTVPLYLGLGTLSVALLPLTILVALAVDAIRRTGHLVTVRCALGLALYFACEALGIIASGWLWIANALWPGSTADRRVTSNLRLQRIWARALFTGATRLLGMRVEVTGAADLNDIWNGKLIGRTIRLCFWRVPGADIPRTVEGRIEWLDTQWERVDAWVAAHSGGQAEERLGAARGAAEARAPGCAEPR